MDFLHLPNPFFHPSGSDLACERKRADVTLAGVKENTFESGNVLVEQISVTSDEGAKSIGKPKGNYITLSHAPAWALWGEGREELTQVLCEQLSSLCAPFLSYKAKETTTVLIAGLGNRSLTSDAIGPRVADRVRATFHLRKNEPELFSGMDCGSVCVLSPGVTAQTGMEAAQTVIDAAKRVRPDLIVAIDALAARSISRLATTIQLCDTGVSPGSGIGNRHHAIDEKTTGVPTVAIGVPTVVHSQTLIYDALCEAGTEELYDGLSESAKKEGFFVSPKDIDETVDILASVISASLNRLWGVESIS